MPAPPTATPGSAPVVSAQIDASSGSNTVIGWYNLVVAGRFDEAYSLWSDRMKANFARQGNLDERWAQTVHITVNDVRVVSQSGNRMTVAIDFVETQTNGKNQRYVGTWQLVSSPRGWLLDQPSF
ncbi:hypothetical protein AYO38_07065 [bacterium SCGC AG-212-C10]|nr:hypothetical protein AYO38_07065 [bacterium SCGC AG-212-C10]